MKQKEEFSTHKLWKSSWKTLKKICVETEESFTEAFDRIVKQEWQRIQEEEHDENQTE